MNFENVTITSKSKHLLADLLTPVTVYMNIRDKFRHPILLESSDYHSKENSLSFICFEPIASFSVANNELQVNMPAQNYRQTVTNHLSIPDELHRFTQSFDLNGTETEKQFNGFFGYSTFDAVQYFETLKLNPTKNKQEIPDILYSFYRYIIVFNHFNEEMTIIENLLPQEKSQLPEIERFLFNHNYATFPFALEGEEKSNLTDQQFMKMVTQGKKHCQYGDVFQIVLSRQFSQQFSGDEFNLYRALRSLNPSPYLFYFDFDDFRIFGSSPEAQIVVKEGKAQIHPIAGTYRRTGNDVQDAAEAKKLSEDPKENAEHVMLVDLARNDLSRNAKGVEVLKYKELQYFSHVIHLVSVVEGKLKPQSNSIQVFADTFPAGTLSGAPKYRAIELIDQYENQHRGFYGGAIGYIGMSGNINQAITIRSFMSKGKTLYYQAGAGVVIDSNEESELNEVNNKLGALKKALQTATKIK